APARRAALTRYLRRTAVVRGPGCSHRPARHSADCPHPADPSRPANTRTRPSRTPDSEEKVIQHLSIEIVHEKNQKKWKLLTDKRGRFFQKAQSDSSRPGSAVERLRSLVGFV